MFGIGGFELFLILLFGFLIFGPDKLPGIAQTIGKGIAKFRNAQQDMSEKLKSESFIDKDSDEPFKNPLDVLGNATAGAVASNGANSKGAPDGAGQTGAACAARDAGASKPAIKDSDRAKSFAERKAQYDKERAERKAAKKAESEAATHDAEAAKMAAGRTEAADNPEADIAEKLIAEKED